MTDICPYSYAIQCFSGIDKSCGDLCLTQMNKWLNLLFAVPITQVCINDDNYDVDDVIINFTYLTKGGLVNTNISVKYMNHILSGRFQRIKIDLLNEFKLPVEFEYYSPLGSLHVLKSKDVLNSVATDNLIPLNVNKDERLEKIILYNDILRNYGNLQKIYGNQYGMKTLKFKILLDDCNLSSYKDEIEYRFMPEVPFFLGTQWSFDSRNRHLEAIFKVNE
jgi:hypothetical protein